MMVLDFSRAAQGARCQVALDRAVYIVLMANQVTNSLLFFVLCILILFYLETNPKNYDVEEHEIKILIEQKRRESNMTVEEIRIMRESERKQMV